MKLLLKEDKRGNIVRLLGYHPSEADMFHEMNPKWSFFLAKMHKGVYDGSIANAKSVNSLVGMSAESQMEINSFAWDVATAANEWLQKYPNEFKNVKNLEFYEFSVYRNRHRKKMEEEEKKKGLMKDATITFPDGFFWHDTKSNTCDEWISDKMQHCGTDEDGHLQILFDDKLEPHGTLTWDKEKNKITQAKGKQNKVPDEKYFKYFEGFFKKFELPEVVSSLDNDETLEYRKYGVILHAINHFARQYENDRKQWWKNEEYWLNGEYFGTSTRTGDSPMAYRRALKKFEEDQKALQENINIKVPEKQLQPDLWQDGKLKEDVIDALLKIADTFLEFLKIQVSVDDIILTGSMANYNWTTYSDIDLHILIDYDMIDDADPEFAREFFKSKRNIWNAKHSIHVKGFEVEVYPQDSAEDHVSSGIYSVQQRRWLIEPQRKVIDHDTSAESVVHKAIEFQHAIDSAKDYSELDRLVDKIWKMRKAGLNKEGEYSEENLIFKHLRNTGYLQKLISFKNIKQDQELSLAEQQLNEDKRGNIMRVLGLPKFIADYYHGDAGAKWSFVFARWWKEKYSESAPAWHAPSHLLDRLRHNGIDTMTKLTHYYQKLIDSDNAWRRTAIRSLNLDFLTVENYDLNPEGNPYRYFIEYIKEQPEIFKQIKNMKLDDAITFVNERQAKSLKSDKNKVIMTFPDGFFWYDSKSSVCPEWMKNQMQHCGRDLRGHMIFLVGPNNDLHGTLTWDKENNEVVQAVGKQNEHPERKYWSYFEEFINQHKAPPTQDMFLPSLADFGNWLWDQMPEELQKPIKLTNELGRTTYKFKGKLHREDGPALYYPNGGKSWYINGKLHREDGPAVERANGKRQWYKDGLLHREDGPATYYEGGLFDEAEGEEYALDGVKLHKSDWEHEVEKLRTIPGLR